MADDFDDVDALLDGALFKKDDAIDNGSRSKDRRSRSRSREHDRKSRDRRSGSRERKRKDRDRRRSRSRERRRSRSPGRRRSRSRDRPHRRSRSRDRGHRGSRSNSKERLRRRSPPRFGGGGRFGRGGQSPPRREQSPEIQLTPEERDQRTIFIMQLSQRVRARDVEEFFSSVGKIKDVRLIVCNKTRRFKGIAYVEFKEVDSVALALGLNGQKLCGVPVIVQPSQAEKNRVGNYYADRAAAMKTEKGPMRLYVGSLHFNITEDMLRGIFEPFGNIQTITLMQDYETGRSKGYGFITYDKAEDAKKALEQMNGFELAGRPMKVGHVTEGAGTSYVQVKDGLDTEEADKTGVDLGATGRLALMAKLAEGTGMKLPQAASQALQTSTIPGATSVAAAAAAAQHSAQQRQQQQLATTNPPIATQCFMLTNMFDPDGETEPGWETEIRDDVIEECNKYGGVLHIYVDKVAPQGNVYVKCPTIATAVSAVNALHGRWFAGKVITAAYVPLVNYHNLFADSAYAASILTTARR